MWTEIFLWNCWTSFLICRASRLWWATTRLYPSTQLGVTFTATTKAPTSLSWTSTHSKHDQGLTSTKHSEHSGSLGSLNCNQGQEGTAFLPTDYYELLTHTKQHTLQKSETGHFVHEQKHIPSWRYRAWIWNWKLTFSATVHILISTMKGIWSPSH